MTTDRHDGRGPMATLRGFRRDEDGAVIPLTIVLFLMMVFASGMAVDFMRHEMARADLQNALDRGVLAATHIQQTLADSEEDARELILEYMASRSYLAPDLELEVDLPAIEGGKIVNASATYELDTFFLRMAGMPKMKIPARTSAQDAASELEISLILDVSDSMTSDSTWTDGTRLSDLQDAAKDFIDAILTDENRHRTSISIVPYSAQVNLPDEMAAAYNIDRHHDYGNCVNFEPGDYRDTDISHTLELEQSQHFFDYWSSYWYRHYYTTYVWVRTNWGWRQEARRTYEWRQASTPENYLCPGEANQILPYSNDRTELRTAIENLTSEGWTASYVGMKWGVALLDPAARPVLAQMIGGETGRVSNNFAGWPRDWDDSRTRKVIVLMTDGRNTVQYKVKPSAYDDHTPAYWNENLVPEDDLEYEVNNRSDGLGDDYLKDICDAAKAQGDNVVIYTIGFELVVDPDDPNPDTLAAIEALNDCASSEATRYLVESVNIDLAFQNIASQIDNLKLTQ